jgi:Domain of unknown function (DUF4234)
MKDKASQPEQTPAIATVDRSDQPAPSGAATKPRAPWSWPLPVDSGSTRTSGTAERSAGRGMSITEVRPASTGLPSLGPTGKHRSAVMVALLSVVTLGVYSLVWQHRVNREAVNFDTRMHVDPRRSTVAVVIPWLLGVLISIIGAVRIVLAVLNVALPFDPHFSVEQAYVLLGGVLVIPYLTLLLPFSAVASVMTLERVRIVEDRIGRPTDAQLRPVSALLWLVVPVVGGLILVGSIQRRLNRVWADEAATMPMLGSRRRLH